MVEHWRTYRVTGHYVIPKTAEEQTYLVEYAPDARRGNAVAFETTVYCPNALEVQQHARRKVSEGEGVPFANVHVESVKVVRYE